MSFFSRRKVKRTRTSSNESNNSFVKNVTTRVTDMLPATITNWFSSPKRTNTNGSARAADITDSSTDDEGSDGPVIPPPQKRMRYSSMSKIHNLQTDTANESIGSSQSFNTTHTGTQTPADNIKCWSCLTQRENTLSESANEDSSDQNDRDTSDLHTTKSKTSALKHNLATQESGMFLNRKRKSLFDQEESKAAAYRASAKTNFYTPLDLTEPRFKPGLVNLGSPFYCGRTMYGGAAYSHINQPNIKQRKQAIVIRPSYSDNSSISQSTKRIMDLLENYSSPLTEAKRMLTHLQNSKNDSMNISSESISADTNKRLSYKMQELHVPSLATILNLKRRSRLTDSTTAARQIMASHSSSSDYYLNQTNTARVDAKQTVPNKMTTKVKSRVSRTHGDINKLEVQAESIDLPNAVLQIDKNCLPKFDFGSPIISTASTSSTAKSYFSTSSPQLIPVTCTVTTPATTLEDKPSKIDSAEEFKFSIPVTISTESISNKSPLRKFTFDLPDISVDKPKVALKEDDNPCSVVGASKEPDKILTTKTTDWKCLDCWVLNKSDVDKCVCCGGKKPAAKSGSEQPSKCSTCKLADKQPLSDKCINCVKTQENSSVSKLAAPPFEMAQFVDDKKWKCEDCLVRNDENADKCVCCGGQNPKKSSKETQNKTKSNESEWKCGDCWIKNTNSVDKCLACGGPKPAAVQAVAPASSNLTATSFKPIENSFKIIKPPTDQWECPSCLVRNDSNKSRCVCCETEKPGAAKESAAKLFNFGMNINTTFKFGIDPKAQVTNLTKPTGEKPLPETNSRVEELETNNNVLDKPPSFTFGVVNSNKTEGSAAADKEKPSEVPKVNFTFGIPNQSNAEKSAPPTFGFKLPETVSKPVEENVKAQEVPTVDITLPNNNEKPKALTSVFGTSLATKFAQEKPVVSTPMLSTSSSSLNKIDTPTIQSTLTPLTETTSVEANGKHNFTFSVAGGGISTTPAGIIFGPSTTGNTSTTTSSTFTVPLQSSSSSVKLPMFQKPDDPAPSTSSLFKNSNIAVTKSNAPEAFLFSFGGTQQTGTQKTGLQQTGLQQTGLQQTGLQQTGLQQTGLQQTGLQQTGLQQTELQQSSVEKPKFNFSFNSNKTESPSMFTSFGLAGNGSATNKYAPVTNASGGVSGMTTGSLIGSNGLLTGNVPGDNGLSTNNPSNAGQLTNNNLSAGNGIQVSNALTPATGIFGASMQKENMWLTPKTDQQNFFATNANTSTIQKPTFTFGQSTSFNANNSTPFGNDAQPAPTLFGISNQNNNNNNTPSLFSSPVQNQTTPRIFGSAQPANNSTPGLAIFGTPNVGAPSTFGTPNSSNPTFETPALTPAPTPTFNFGGPQTSRVFGFGQQQQPSQQAPAQSAYNFSSQVQFNMGSAPNMAPRRVRKAVRRNTPR